MGPDELVDKAQLRLGRLFRSAGLLPAYPPRRMSDFGLRGRTSRRSVALTFDDGPDPLVTPKVLDALDVAAFKATFFMCGVAASRHPELVSEVVGRGHVVGNHTWHHQSLTGIAVSRWDEEVRRTNELLEDLTNRRVRLFRPPYGDYNGDLLAWLNNHNLTPVLWSLSGHDWVEDDPKRIAQNVTDRLCPRDIVLLHDGCGDLLVPGSTVPPHITRDRTPTAIALAGIGTWMQARRLGSIPLQESATALPRRLRRLHSRA